jgi:hypothetical protein
MLVRRFSLVVASVLICSGATTVASVSQVTTPVTGAWNIVTREDGELQLELRWSDSTQWRRPIAMADLRGFPPGALESSRPIKTTFRMEREPGDFSFDGSVVNGRASGQFDFQPKHTFASILRGLGLVLPDEVRDHDLKNLAFGDMSAASVQEFRQLGLTSLSFNDLVDLAIRQVQPDYVRSLQRAGYTDLTVRKIEDLKMSGLQFVRRSRLTRFH